MKPVVKSALIVLLGYAVAVLSAPVFAYAILVASEFAAGDAGSTGWGDVGSFLIVGIYLTGVYSALPFIVAIALLRRFRITNWALHGLAGVAVSVAAMALLFGGDPGFYQMHPAFPLTGGCAGLVYWAVRRRFGWS